ncbi:Gfo/Idh/MocA family oxidoreductase [uncultured Vagococcus sp.]|uniref:Gfo/Idh/MocA family protein n=1 Tax=uncultured Vagococcus sp. TaxID=189676 RepID=UPI0028D4A276|nr:Gfo/Idh/MocA family oxidoreductase [uncultured Vagococcus sp.]
MKLAILGSGMIVHDFLSMVQQLPAIELKAIVGTERSREKLTQLQQSHHIEKSFTDFDTCLSESDIDTVYVALPNHLHYEYAKKALAHKKNVICEKPFTLTVEQFMELKEIALANKLVLVEAITNQYLANYREIKAGLAELGDIKIIECNYSQYSSRYDAFKEGTILPAFNPRMGGGALMDINIYNIHFVVGLLGKPQKVEYVANVERGIDTSGIVVMSYPETKVVCIGAKDSTSAIRSTIQGNEGAIVVNGATNVLDSIEKQLNGEGTQAIDVKVHSHRMFEEFKEFERIIDERDMAMVEDRLTHSQLVMEVIEQALDHAGISLG